MQITHTVAERFLRYVQIDTQSDPLSSSYPSTEKQKNMLRLLVEELHAMGIADAEMDKYGYVYATIPATSEKNTPVICFCAHVDTAPDCSGTNVKPLVHRNYQGQDIVLPDDKTVVISPKKHPELLNNIGNDIITASGLTLLGSDDKSGVAEIMDAAHFFMTNPQVKHGKIRLLFTPDEEVGAGVDHVDMAKLGAKYGYTLDGGTIGDIENETFSADGAVVSIEGVSAHPGYAKGKMENAIKIAAEIVAALPKTHLSPESTEGYEGFLHPTGISGGLESAKVSFIVRDHITAKLAEHTAVLQGIIDGVLKNYPNSHATIALHEQYRNMGEILAGCPFVYEYAVEATRRTGLTPKLGSIRGGTDGSRLSFMGLPCPNIFAGEHGIHSKQEWCSVQDMEKSVETIIHLAMIWEENTKA